MIKIKNDIKDSDILRIIGNIENPNIQKFPTCALRL